MIIYNMCKMICWKPICFYYYYVLIIFWKCYISFYYIMMFNFSIFSSW